MIRAGVARASRAADRLRRKFDTSNPFELADFLECVVDLAPHPRLLGFCTPMLGVRVIGLNSRADAYTRACACAHELGHLCLNHLKDPEFRIRHFSELSNVSERFESEANAFAAQLLMSDSEAVDALKRYETAARAAASLCVCPELFRAKILLLNEKGRSLPVPPMPKRAWSDERYLETAD